MFWHFGNTKIVVNPHLPKTGCYIYILLQNQGKYYLNTCRLFVYADKDSNYLVMLNGRRGIKLHKRTNDTIKAKQCAPVPMQETNVNFNPYLLILMYSTTCKHITNTNVIKLNVFQKNMFNLHV